MSSGGWNFSLGLMFCNKECSKPPNDNREIQPRQLSNSETIPSFFILSFKHITTQRKIRESFFFQK